jgi:hypothetical protein
MTGEKSNQEPQKLKGMSRTGNCGPGGATGMVLLAFVGCGGQSFTAPVVTPVAT